MWLIICWCAVSISRGEKQHLFALFREVMQVYSLKPSGMDTGLLFSAPPQEMLAALERRRDLIQESQALIEDYSRDSFEKPVMHQLVRDHIHILLTAELESLNRIVDSLAAERSLPEQMDHRKPLSGSCQEKRT